MRRQLPHREPTRPTSRRGQVWSGDFAISILIFSAAALIAFTLIINAFDDRSYEDVRKQASDSAALLGGDGYPQHWTAGDVIRAGLASDGVLSLRKADELAALNADDLKSALRVSDNLYVYVTGQDGVIGIFGSCGIGDIASAGMPGNDTLPAMAIASAPVLSAAAGIVPTVGDDAFYNLTQQDVVIIEGAIISGLADAEIMRLFQDAARRGMTFIIVGDPGIPILGVRTNATPIAGLTVDGDGERLGFSQGEALTVSGTFAALDPANVTADASVRNYAPIATVGGKDVYAAWLYGDARVWYLATTDGTHANGTAIIDTLANATQGMVEVSRPVCGAAPVPDAEQLAMHKRMIVHHDQLLELNVLVWRDD